ncbi:MAG: transcriptional regulator [Acidobacteriota bacterium]
MMIKVIRNKEDYEVALTRIDKIIDSIPGTDEGNELEVLGILVSDYEDSNEPIGLPSIPDAIRFEMDRLGLDQKGLIPFIGSRPKVSEILAGKIRPSLRMMRALHKHLGIPAEVLLQDPDASLPQDKLNLDWSRFPLKEMISRQWIKSINKNVLDHAEESIRPFIDRAGGFSAVPEPVFKTNDSPRQNARRDPYAVTAWCLKIIIEDREFPLPVVYKTGTVDLEFMRHLAKFSSVPSGPKAAVEFLAQYGIRVVFEKQLSKCYFDAAAMMTSGNRPLIGMTLRYDRLDNFWFCLFHELAHIGKHLEKGDSLFIDDLSLREHPGEDFDIKEKEADDMAEEALLPRARWQQHSVSSEPSVANVLDMASKMKIHPAIVAGRARYETNNYRILARHVGQGQVGQLFYS